MYSILRLQWGRDQLVAEIFDTGFDEDLPDVASMGPRPIGRGNNHNTNRAYALFIKLQWGRDQLVAEIPSSCSYTTPFEDSFTGAATNWSRKC